MHCGVIGSIYFRDVVKIVVSRIQKFVDNAIILLIKFVKFEIQKSALSWTFS